MSVCRRNLQVAVAVFAGDFLIQVLRCQADFFGAVGAVGVEGSRPDARVGDVELELALAELARDDTRWNKAKAWLVEQTGGIVFSLLRKALLQQLHEQLGMSTE